jgi:metal-responsive CopG/Arc/MetJ family transcriptional regulator
MGKAAKKINISIDEEISRDLEKLVPSRKRQQVINEALRKELELIRRKKASDALLSNAKTVKRFPTSKIIKTLGRDRGMH